MIYSQPMLTVIYFEDMLMCLYTYGQTYISSNIEKIISETFFFCHFISPHLQVKLNLNDEQEEKYIFIFTSVFSSI